MSASAVRVVLRETVGEIIMAPVWWYSRGALRAFERCRARIREANDYLGFMVWLTNIFVPMYGQYDFMGRFISIGMRMVQIIARGVALAVSAIVSITLFVAYLVLPIFITTEIIIQWIHLL